VNKCSQTKKEVAQMAKNKFSFFSVILSVICVVFVAEACAPAAAIGNAQFFGGYF
jgi:hypothetical protein